MSKNREDALKAFEALAHDVVQFDDHPPIDPERHDNGLFSQKVPPYMKSYLLNWMRRFISEHGDTVRSALCSDPPPPKGGA